MGLFGNKSEGGLMDVIRCEEKNILFGNGVHRAKPTQQKRKMQSAKEVVCELKTESYLFLCISKKMAQCRILLLALMTKQ